MVENWVGMNVLHLNHYIDIALQNGITSSIVILYYKYNSPLYTYVISLGFVDSNSLS